MKRRAVLLILWTLFLFGVLLAPVSESAIPPFFRFNQSDKVAHVILFAVTGFMGVLSTSTQWQFKSRALFAFLFGLLLAVSTEVGQSLLASRDASFYDLLADLVGLGVGILLSDSNQKN